MKGEMKVAPAFAASRAWLAEKQSVTLTMRPSEVSALQALRPSMVRGTLMAMLSAILERMSASRIISLNSTAVTSAETGPSTISQISLVTSRIGRPDFMISEGLVVTPSSSPVSLNARISLTSAVSTKNFMGLSFVTLAEPPGPAFMLGLALIQETGKVTSYETRFGPRARDSGDASHARRAALLLCRARWRHRRTGRHIARAARAPRGGGRGLGWRRRAGGA